MKILLPFLLRLATGDPIYHPVHLHLDMSGVNLPGQGSETDVLLQYNEIYPGVARVLDQAGVAIVEPEEETDKLLLDQVAIDPIPRSKDDVTLHVGLSWQQWGNWAYVIHLEVEHPDGERRAIPSIVCEALCPPKNIGPRIDQEKESVLGLLRLPDSSATANADGNVAGSQAPIEQPTDRPMKVGWLGVSGIVLGVAGFGVGTFGLVNTLTPDRRVADPDNDEVQTVERYRTPGSIAALAVGATAFAVGFGVMLVLDQVRSKPSSKKPVGVVPIVGPRWAGLQWMRTF